MSGKYCNLTRIPMVMVAAPLSAAQVSPSDSKSTLINSVSRLKAYPTVAPSSTATAGDCHWAARALPETNVAQVAPLKAWPVKVLPVPPKKTGDMGQIAMELGKKLGSSGENARVWKWFDDENSMSEMSKCPVTSRLEDHST